MSDLIASTGTADGAGSAASTAGAVQAAAGKTTRPHSNKAPGGWHAYVYMATTTLTLVTVVVFTVISHRSAVEQLKATGEISAAVDAMRKEQIENARVPFVAGSELESTVSATNLEVEVKVTNTKDSVLASCFQAVLTKTGAEAVQLKSIPMCTGRMEPLSTKTLFGQWAKGNAKTVCGKTRYGHPDWDGCEVDLKPYTPGK